MTFDFLTTNLKENIDNISLKFNNNSNFKLREIIIGENIRSVIFYISGLTDKNEIQDTIIKPLVCNNSFKHDNYDIIDVITKKILYSCDISVIDKINDIDFEILGGKCVLLIENQSKAIVCNVKSSKYRSIQESTTEKSILGAKESFVESIELNLTMIQRKIKNPNFKYENYIIGKETNTQVTLVYVENIIDPIVLNKIKSKISSIDLPMIPYAGFIEQSFDKRVFNIFPATRITEKPDKAVFELVKGKAIILIEEYPGAVILPTTFIEFFQGSEDYSDKPTIASFSRLLRFLAIITVVVLEPMYLTLIYYNSELFPYELISIIISSRQNIPLPPLLEIFTMDLAVEILREGGIRLPNPIGTTLAIVGGIVIGESATKVGLVSSITLFIVAVTVISTFLIPNYQMTLSIRFIRFPLLFLSQMFGFLGLLSGLYLFLIILTKLEFFGVRYFSPFMPMRFSDISDTIIRGPIKTVLSVPKSIKPSIRTKK
ncbi:hypothetical protein Q428_02670 [Fervidicella metallireducens AeB]|uniref:Spore germination protein n=1 Tax=Fervidicella metallireducens AeB TaxID=1403537 RepID=A0A017RXD2_9CLOT|nr:spore germination protein [Fervidicella metallireducens]EYE89357.1 hypothetical protein Q428_02670 [Fervidicella metallireducens AeB]